MSKKLKLMALFLMLLLLSGCTSVTKIALMTKLESGSLYGISEVDSAKYYLKSNGINNIEIVPYNDGWDPERIESVYNEIREDDIDIIIASHPSSCALELLDLINKEEDPVIVFFTASTTDRLSGVDDSIYRVIQDVEKEQKSIAEYIATEEYNDLLVVRDTENYGYTEPAEEYFKKYYIGNLNVIDVHASKFNSSEIEAVMQDYSFDAIYLLIGDYQANAGVIAQVAVKLNNEVDIYYTPWMKTPDIIDTAGNTIYQSVMPSHYPARNKDEEVNSYIEAYKKEYDYVPTFDSLNVFKVMEVINQNIMQGKRDPISMKKNIDSIRSYETKLGPVNFDEFGDTETELFFIDDIKREFE